MTAASLRSLLPEVGQIYAWALVASVSTASDGGKHVAGGRRGKECEARHERSNDWRRGAQRPRPVP